MTKHHYFREDYFAGELSERAVEDVFRNPLSEAEKQKAIKLMKEGRHSEIFNQEVQEQNEEYNSENIIPENFY